MVSNIYINSISICLNLPIYIEYMLLMQDSDNIYIEIHIYKIIQSRYTYISITTYFFRGDYIEKGKI